MINLFLIIRNILINKKTKIIIAIILILLSIYNFFILKIRIGILLITISLLLLILFFKNEFIIIAFLNFRNGNLKNMNKYLNFIINPKIQLVKNQQSYYYFLKGLQNLKLNINKSEKYLLKSLKLGLKFRYNCVIAKLNLANILISKGKKKEAEIYLSDAKKLDKAGLMEDHIKLVKKQIKKMRVEYNNQNPYLRNKIISYKSGR